MENYEEKINKLKEDTLENVKISNNKITGNIEVEKDKLLCFSIPYNEGWSIKIDGKETQLYKANTMYMMAKVKKGYHEIELNYITPGLKEGIILSVIGLILFIKIVLKEKKIKE